MTTPLTAAKLDAMEKDFNRCDLLDWMSEHTIVSEIERLIASHRLSDAEVARLREALPDPDKLELLARWIDLKESDNPNVEVQMDLRRWARQARTALVGKETPNAG